MTEAVKSWKHYGKLFAACFPGDGLLSYCTMPKVRALEISVESVAAAIAAERGGADRIELCGDMSVGGLTPDAEMMHAARANVRLPIFAMIRPRAGDFFYTNEEFEAMQESIRLARQLQMDGVVFGILTADRRIDVGRTRELAGRAAPADVTFHRAFDECADLRQSLEDVIRTGASRLLTSGGKRTAPEAHEAIADLVRITGERVIVVPGSGIHSGNISEMVRKTGAREYHAGLSSIIPDPVASLGAFEEEVRKLAEALGDGDRN